MVLYASRPPRRRGPLTVLQFKPARPTGPTQFHRHRAVHMANAELRHKHAVCLSHTTRPRRSRWTLWLMAYALGFVIWALSLCVGALMFESAAARATPTRAEMGVAGDTFHIPLGPLPTVTPGMAIGRPPLAGAAALLVARRARAGPSADPSLLNTILPCRMDRNVSSSSSCS
jgi:hypothetical protein